MQLAASLPAFTRLELKVSGETWYYSEHNTCAAYRQSPGGNSNSLQRVQQLVNMRHDDLLAPGPFHIQQALHNVQGGVPGRIQTPRRCQYC